MTHFFFVLVLTMPIIVMNLLVSDVHIKRGEGGDGNDPLLLFPDESDGF